MNKLDTSSPFTVGFIGLGLIGGSIAKRLSMKFDNITIIGYNRSQSSLDIALSEHVLTTGVSEIGDNFNNCDFIFLCTPVEYNVEYLKQLKGHIKPGCIITDVGSVKSNIHAAVIELGMEDCFIGGHPMAGSEKTGYVSSTPFLLENAFYALTKTSLTTHKDLENLSTMVEAMGAIPVILDYDRHDYVVAAISHLPHLIASSLVNLVKDNDDNDEHMKQIAAGGFKDITRIASSSPEMWQQICDSNSDNICELLHKYIESLEEICDNLSSHSTRYVYNMFEKSRDYRNSFSGSGMGPIKKIHYLCCDIIDQAGAISSVALLLANNRINIKNIGIVHNREHEEGVLKIVFNNDEDVSLAGKVLTNHGYTVYYNN